MSEEIKKPSAVQELLAIMKRLRAPDGCPWDRKQTHKSIKPHLMEECGELLDAIEENDDAGMLEELGDVLMHITLHSAMAEERGAFTFEDVARQIVDKMIRRHPHVFGDAKAANAEEVVGLWEEVKRREHERDTKPRISLLDGIPNHCPALLQAEKMQKKAAKVGFDWTNVNDILDKIAEETAELKDAFKNNDEANIDEEIGDLLFAVVNLARFRNRKSSEELLADTNAKFSKRFRHIEKRVSEAGKKLEDCKISELEAYWQEAKKL